MELHRDLNLKADFDRPSLTDSPRGYFKKALKFVEEYYPGEIERVSSVRFRDLTPESFFKEYIWVVHATGFSAKAVGSFIPRLLEAYGDSKSLSVTSFDVMMDRVRKVCNNPAKAKAVWLTSRSLEEGRLKDGWENWKNQNLSSPELLEQLPYIGKVTCYHLGRNIGLLDCVKPDLHLVRMSSHWGFESCVDMCREMQAESGLPLGIIDLVLWFSASTFGTIEIKQGGAR